MISAGQSAFRLFIQQVFQILVGSDQLGMECVGDTVKSEIQ
jgi:hypothetical protein